MDIAEIRNAAKTQPFRPFTMRMSDGRRFAVRHPELLHMFPGMERRAVLGISEEHAVQIIDLLHVTSLTVAEGNGSPSGNGGSN